MSSIVYHIPNPSLLVRKPKMLYNIVLRVREELQHLDKTRRAQLPNILSVYLKAAALVDTSGDDFKAKYVKGAVNATMNIPNITYKDYLQTHAHGDYYPNFYGIHNVFLADGKFLLGQSRYLGIEAAAPLMDEDTYFNFSNPWGTASMTGIEFCLVFFVNVFHFTKYTADDITKWAITNYLPSATPAMDDVVYTKDIQSRLVPLLSLCGDDIRTIFQDGWWMKCAEPAVEQAILVFFNPFKRPFRELPRPFGSH